MITLDEEIVSLRKSASKSLDYEWQREQYQIADWLEELKAYRDNSNGYSKEDIELNRKAMYNKALDDFVNACKEDILCHTFGLHINGIERIAGGLKAGEENEQSI